MSDFIFRVSPNIIISSYSASRLGEFALEYGKRFILILDPILKAVGIADKITQSLKDSNVDYFIFDELAQVADSKTARLAINLAKNSHVQGVIAAGGAKALGIARAVAAFCYESEDLYDFIDQPSFPKKAPIPLIALPTTCRAPTLFTDKIPITDSRTHQVKLLKVSYGLCKAAVFDPNMTVTLTEHQINSLSLESLCLCAESYFSQKSNFFSEMLAEKSAILLHYAMDGADSLSITTPKEELLVQGGCMASLAASISSFGPAGIFAIVINGRFKISRSLVSSILFPYVIEDCAKFKTEKVAAFAKLLAIKPSLTSTGATESEILAKSLAENIRQRIAMANLPTRLKDLSITMDQLALAAQDASSLEYANSLPRSMTGDDLFELVKAAF
ncbi:iron-containing alcohol dehydrogenase [Treponema pectinovorum]|uniref:iron-containing alcohol dehydrogenase n=1 Tax=Treponema pectinovorum TaxID=164 RepID=UPI0011C9267A|nr:iron-containing alcohol dehydrogenase [Treponema pectinovorum]